ncbi:response regulator transcription factor [Parahaliea mediterranea]|uniref:response regulator transcription factor n=1 Tax=Parahaliea mediterranea TaxID=651086 RepID=UPI000E2EF867|nr:response regulator transcription factor [Parahaliea mediterranea]
MQAQLIRPAPGPRVLVVEDDAALGQQLGELLAANRFVTRHASDGAAGLRAALEEPFDLILLDVLLPGMDGYTVLRQLRQTRQTPVVMLTACNAEEERIRGFTSGADDYVAKPFSFTELLLRIEALLRRAGGEPVQPATQALHAPPLTLHRVQQRACVSGADLKLTPIQFKLLWTLVAFRGEVMSKAYLYQLVLQREFSRYDRSIDMHLSRVRRRLGAAGFDVSRLQTLHGRGYRFT